MAQEVSVNARLDTNILLIGDQTILHLELLQPKSKKVYWPNIAENKLGQHFDILNIDDFDTIYTPNSDIITIKKDLLISSFDTGFISIPSLSFKYDIVDDTTYYEVLTPELFLGVFALKVDMEKGIADIKPIMEVPIIWQDYILYIIGGIILIILLIVGFYIYKKIKNKEPIFVLPKKPIIPPHIIAKKELDKLSDRKLWQNNEFKEYYSSLTDIIRTYMDGIWGFGAMEMVSDDIIDNIKSKEISKELRKSTEDILRTADFVKFAKTKPLANDNATALKWAYDFIEQTMPKLETSEKKEEVKS